MKKSLVAILLLAALLLTACAPKHIDNDGTRPFELGLYDLQTEGLLTLAEQLRFYQDMPPLLRVTTFEGEVNRRGELSAFSLSLYGYDTEQVYQGWYIFHYGGENGLEITLDPLVPQAPPAYNQNGDLYFLDGEFKRVQWSQQLPLLDFDSYYISFNDIARPAEGTPIIDASQGGQIPLLTLEEARQGQGGTTDGGSGVYFIISDGMGMTSENLVYMKMKTADPETVGGNRDYVMALDYRILDDTFWFTRDYGESWIAAKLPAGALEETLAFYRNGLFVPDYSYSITGRPGALALIYGEKPALLLSVDDGASWRTVDIDLTFARIEAEAPSVTKRIVHFFDEQVGYMGLGTDWSMGAGEAKALFFTEDGGESWQVTYLPIYGTSRVLTGLAFADRQHGVMTAKHPFNTEEPAAFFYTGDGGASWHELVPPDEMMPDGYTMIHRVDSLTLEDGQFALELGAGADRVLYLADSLAGPWAYEDTWTAVTHTVG